MRVQESTHGHTMMRVPHHQHTILTGVSSDEPLFVLWASCRSDLIAVALEETLCLFDVVVDDTGVGASVENFGAVFAG